MKTTKLLAILCASAVCGQAYAAQVGDLMLVDGIPAVVISIDETGQHGLVCSSIALSNYGLELTTEQVMEDYGISEDEAKDKVLSNLNTPVLMYMDKDDKQEKKAIKDLATSNSIYGKENAEQIRTYCETNDIDMATYFPEQYWAMQMGDGWFIPGVYELEQYAAFLRNGKYGVGSGKEAELNGQDIKDISAKIKEVLDQSTEKYGTGIRLYSKIQSSTLIESSYKKSKEGKRKVERQNKSNVLIAIMSAARSSEYLQLALLCNGTQSHGQFSFISDGTYDTPVFAVKEF